jgi:hypothetical protein
MQHFSVKEQQRTESLVLGGSGNLTLHRQVSEKGIDFFAAHLLGVSLVVKQDISTDPEKIRLLSLVGGVVLDPEGITDLLQELSGSRYGSVNAHSAE